MSLVHYFSVISKDSTQTIVGSNMEKATISDSIIQYINDSLCWVHTRWNGKKLEKGISYYGYSIIEGDEINKFQDIIKQWKGLFQIAPDEFCLTCEFIPDENQYEKKHMKRERILGELEELLDICEKAIERKEVILHNGI